MASVVEDMRKQEMLRNAQVKTPGIMQRAFPNTTMALNQRQSDIQSAQNTGGAGAAIGQSFRTAMTPVFGLADDMAAAASRVLNPAAQALKTFATGDTTPIGAVAPSPLVNAAVKTPIQAAPQAPLNQTAATMMGGIDRLASAPTAAPAQSAPLAPGVYNHGRGQYSDNPDGMGSMPTGKPNAQNIAAADALAARYKSAPAAPEQMGGAQVFGQSGGYGLLDNNRIAQRNAMMDVQQMKPGSKMALASLLKQQGDAPEQQIARDRLAQDGQQSQDRMALESRGLDQRALESAQGIGLKRDELADNSLTNAAKRDAAKAELSSGLRLQKLQDEYLNAKDEKSRATALQRLAALSGKNQQDEYMAVGAGETVIDAMGTKVKNPDTLVNKRTGQPIGGQPKAAQSGPVTVASAEDMAKLPSGAVFIGPDGKQYKKN